MKLLPSWKSARYMQYLAAITATLSIATSGTYLNWPSPILPQLTSPDSPIGTTITKDEASWIAASPMLGLVPGSLLTILFIEKIGRKTILLFSAIPAFVPWIVCAFAESATTIIAARFVAGLVAAAVYTVVPMYIGEIADKDIRGKLGLTFSILKLFGAVYVLSVGPFVSYKALTLGCAAFPFVFAVLFFFMPESPYYCVKNGNKRAAEKNLLQLSCNNIDKQTFNDHMNEIVHTVENDMENKPTLRHLVSNYETRKALLIMIAIKTFHQFNGLSAIEAYMQTIIKLSSSSISPELSSIIFGVVQIPAVIVAAILVDKLGRKPLYIISSVGCAVTLTAEGIYFYFQDVVHANVKHISWLPTTALVIYVVMNPIGVNTLPYLWMGEFFATNVKGIAISVVMIFSGALAFLVVMIFEPISSAWGIHYAFWLFGGMCILGCIFVVLVVPETKGKSFTEIQRSLTRGKTTRSDGF